MNTVRKLEDRRFVIFDAAQIDVNSIVALAYQRQNVNGQDKDGKPTTVQIQVAVLMLDTGGSITLGSDGLKKFEIWWKENVKAEKIDLPVEVVTEVVPPPPATPALASAPEKTAPKTSTAADPQPETTAPERPSKPLQHKA